MLKNSGLKYGYSSENSSIVNDFYIPALKVACHYDRAVGFFSSASLSVAARGLAPFLESSGTMRLIIGYPVSVDDFSAIQSGVNYSLHLKNIEGKIDEFLSNVQENLECRRFDALSYLIAIGRLQIRFAFRPRGMYHEKIGVIRDGDGEKVAFLGSANETENALSDDINSESISAFYSWDEAIFMHYGFDIEDRFEKLWNDEQPITKTIPANEKFIKRLADFHCGKSSTDIINGLIEVESGTQEITDEVYDHMPKLPKFIGSNKYQLRQHQKNALGSWVQRSYRGILKLATGAGKTITALHAATVIASHDHFNRGLCLIVAVPYQGLAEQWFDEMKLFGMNAILCYKSQSIWLHKLKNSISEFNLATSQTFLSIIVVNDTLKKTEFLVEIKKVNPNRVLFVGDECHNHASEKIINILPNANLRLGLSATPWSVDEVDKRNLLTEYYGDIVAEYNLRDAIDDQVLCPYDYFPIHCEMNNEEADAYEDLSSKIGKFEAIKENGGYVNEDALMHLYLKRSRLLGNLQSKLVALDRLVKENGIKTHTLFYCGEGGSEIENDDDESTIDAVTKILHSQGWRTSKFTSEQSLSLRSKIMDSFKNANVDALVSKRVLDEGIDVPACSQAYIMASTRNERQYVQRRGRVLRKSANKTKAIIYDFIAKPPVEREGLSCFVSMFQLELKRIEEFSSLSLNGGRNNGY